MTPDLRQLEKVLDEALNGMPEEYRSKVQEERARMESFVRSNGAREAVIKIKARMDEVVGRALAKEAI